MVAALPSAVIPLGVRAAVAARTPWIDLSWPAAAELPAVTAATQVRNGSEDESVIGAETGEPGRRPPKHTRRVVLAGGIATLAIAGGAAAVAGVPAAGAGTGTGGWAAGGSAGG